MIFGAMSLEELGQHLVNTLSLGSTYALLALGLAMVFSIVGLVKSRRMQREGIPGHRHGMALTGVLNGIDRDLVPEDDVLVHGSGSYRAADFAAVPAPHLTPVTGLAELARVAADAMERGAGGR